MYAYRIGEVDHILPELHLTGFRFKYTSGLRSQHEELLKLLDDFDTMTELNNIAYQIRGNTLLGAVRHQGFIPWETNTEVEILASDLANLENAYSSSPDYKVSSYDSYAVVSPIVKSKVELVIQLLNFDTGYSYLNSKLENTFTYEDYHPRRRYPFEDIMLWGPQKGEDICLRQKGVDCLTKAHIPYRCWLRDWW